MQDEKLDIQTILILAFIFYLWLSFGAAAFKVVFIFGIKLREIHETLIVLSSFAFIYAALRYVNIALQVLFALIFTAIIVFNKEAKLLVNYISGISEQWSSIHWLFLYLCLVMVFLFFASLFYWIYQFFSKYQIKKLNKTRIQFLMQEIEKELNSGAEAEKMVEATACSILNEMGCAYCTASSQGIENVVIPSTRQGYSSREIDILIVADFGVLVIEVKHWDGKISLLNGAFEFNQNGKISTREDPLEKTQSKASALVRGYSVKPFALVVFSHDRSICDPSLTRSHIHIKELKYVLKKIRASVNHAEKIEPLIFIQVLKKRLDMKPDAKLRHMLTLSDDRGGNIARFKQNYWELQKLQGEKYFQISNKSLRLAGKFFLASLLSASIVWTANPREKAQLPKEPTQPNESPKPKMKKIKHKKIPAQPYRDSGDDGY